MDIRSALGKQILFFDGGMGTMLQQRGLKGGELPELLNLTHPEWISEIHEAYLTAGCRIVTANTFGANPIKAAEHGFSLQEVIAAGMQLAKEAAGSFGSDERPCWAAMDIGPLGKLMEPLGELSFDRAYEYFREIVLAAVHAGADLFIIETMSDTLEAKAAILAVKENSSLPVFCTMTFDENGKTLTGGSPEVVASVLEGVGADCIGVNCGLGPDQLYEIVRRLHEAASIPVMAQPNAGLPQIRNGKTVYDVLPKAFAESMARIAKLGLSVLGGCCGTTPEHIKEMIDVCSGFSPEVLENQDTVVTSYAKAVVLNQPVIIGERINPTGKKKFKEALRAGDMDYILNEAIMQQEAGAHILDVNVGLPEIQEKEMMERAVKAVSATVNLPLQIDSSEPEVIERALRIYNGKAIVNSVNGKKEVMEAVFPLVKKYGGVVVGLALDEDGIPPTAEGRFEIAKRIVTAAAEYGIKKKDILIDALTLTVSAQQSEAGETVKALKLIKEKLGVKTVLGVSNISFGLPRRELVNSTFFALALQSGLDACIINPCAQTMMDTYHSYRTLTGLDENCSEYVALYSGTKATTVIEKAVAKTAEEEQGDALYTLIVKGLKDQSYQAAKAALKNRDSMAVINESLIPALDYVGQEFEAGRMFLPQLMMSAETVKRAFDAVRESIEASGKKAESKGKIVLATVKGDIHDIGKNIVRVLLENYGYNVLDLGKDVPPEAVVTALRENDIHLCGLSALMTTTVLSMEKTIQAIRQAELDAKVFVGGAVLTQEYADMIGADAYTKDALASVNYANAVFGA